MTTSTETTSPVVAPQAGSAVSSLAMDKDQHVLNTLKTEADAFKVEGNRQFAQKKFPSAVEKYTNAINLIRDHVENTIDSHEERISTMRGTAMAIYLVNRAMCSLKQENYGSALLDVADALELDPEPRIKSKAYYRQGFAHYALLKNEEALADFKLALQLSPNDAATRQYVKTIQKEIRIKKFCEAISKPDEQPLYTTMNLEDLIVPSGYQGPSWVSDNNDCEALLSGPVNLPFIQLLAQYFKLQKRLPNRLAAALIIRAISLFKEDANCVHVEVEDGHEITVCGDVHGQYYDLLNIFDMNGYPSATNPYIFNGDFVDRGAWSVECALLLFACKVAFPKYFYMSRGNHETKNINKIYGFKGECDSKFKMPEMYDLFSEAFMWLPLCHIINNKVFCVHGGLPSDDAQGIKEINALNRYSEPTDLQTSGQVLLNDLLWADPRPEMGRVPSPRGVSSHFGPDVTTRFLENNQLEYVIRSHEVKDDGYEVMHGGKIITVFSAPNYCDMVKNQGAFIRLKAPQLTPDFTTFREVDHPTCSALQYASPLIQMSG